MSRWLVTYHDGDQIVAKLVVDESGTRLPFGVGAQAAAIAPGTEFMVNSMVEVPESWTPEEYVVVLDEDREALVETVVLADD